MREGQKRNDGWTITIASGTGDDGAKDTMKSGPRVDR